MADNQQTTKLKFAPPPVYRPQATGHVTQRFVPPARVAAPPVYRPQAAAPVTQRFVPLARVAAPPVYRPQAAGQVTQRSVPPARVASPPVYRPQAAAQVTQRFAPAVRVAAPPVYRPQTAGQVTQRSASPAGTAKPPVQRPQAGGAAIQQFAGPGAAQRVKRSRGSIVQRKVIINEARPYVGTEVINTFSYIRDGSPGGNHFVSDSLIRNIVGEVVTNQTRDDAADILDALWGGLGFTGVLTVSKANTQLYDASVNSLISAISNQASNRFTCAGSGDGGGTRIDRPVTQSAKNAVLPYATKLASGLNNIKASLGNIGHSVMYELDDIVTHNFADDDVDMS